MRSSNTFRNRAGSVLRWIGAAVLLMATIRTAHALDPLRTMSQYVRDRWSTESGFPRGPIYSITQTADGYLWIGTEQGLVRSDGLSFHIMPSSAAQIPELTHILGLLADKDGSLWVRMRRPTLIRYRAGAFKNVMSDFGRRGSNVTAMARAADGSLLLWVLEGEGHAIVLRGRTFETLASPVRFTRSPVLALAQTQDGDVWVGTRDAGLFRMRNGEAFAISKGLPDLKVNTIAPARDNELWIGTDKGLVRWDGRQITRAGVPRSLDGEQILAVTVDRDSNLWVGTNSRGLVRLNAQGIAFDEEHGAGTEAVTALFEDREGNLWAGTGNGLERLHNSAFVTYSSAEGLPSDGNKPLFVDSDNRMWFPPVQGGLWWLKDGHYGRVAVAGLDHDIVYSISGGKGSLWLGRQQGGLTLIRQEGKSFQAKTYTQADGLAQNSVYSVYQSRDGSVWAGTLSGGVSHLRNAVFTTYTNANGLPSNTVNSILEDSAGTIWLATPKGLSIQSDTRWQTFAERDGLPSEDINCLTEDSKGVLWIGTRAGIALRASNRFQVPGNLPTSLREPTYGIAEDRFGSLWVETSNHVMRVKRDALITGSFSEGDVREYGIADGLRGVEGVRRDQSVTTDPLGRIWFSLNRGISVVDPARLIGNSAVAIVHVQTIATDGYSVATEGPVHIAGGHKRITFGYVGLSLSVPERVRFRYRLDGFDHTWSEPVTAREAVYTNLGLGSYRFRVIASNPDGIWSSDEASVAFRVDPLFWQTWWFLTSAGLAFAIAVAALYRFRLAQITKRLRIRFDERLDERTRIAQELHDTLLQGFVSASLQVHIAADCLPLDSEERPRITRAQQLMKEVIREGGNAIAGLRSSDPPLLDLASAFSRIPGEFVPEEEGCKQPIFKIIVEGRPRRLYPALRDEVYRIGREALINAFRHARAENIELKIKFSLRYLSIVVRDDGIGIDTQTLRGGRSGHWGLAGMGERADRIGARLNVRSRAGAATEIELIVPAHLAYQYPRNGAVRWFLARTARKTGKQKTESGQLNKIK